MDMTSEEINVIHGHQSALPPRYVSLYVPSCEWSSAWLMLSFWNTIGVHDFVWPLPSLMIHLGTKSLFEILQRPYNVSLSIVLLVSLGEGVEM